MARALVALAASLTALSTAAQPAPTSPAADPLRSPPPAAGERPAPAPPAAAEPAPSAAAKPPLPRGAVLEEVSGTVRDLDRRTYKLSVDTPNGPVTISLDRNTMVYTAGGLATVLDVKPGAQIRAGRNADFLAYWVQVRSPAKQEPPSTPGQGTGPAGGASAPAGESGTAPAPSTPGAVPGGAPPR